MKGGCVWCGKIECVGSNKRCEWKDGVVRSLEADGGGLRFDQGKTRTDLLPGDTLLALGEVYRIGAEKYAPRNWERGMPWSKVLGPLTRHLFKWMAGEKVDKESGQSHMAHVAWNALALMTYEIRNIGERDCGPVDLPKGKGE